MWDLEYDNAKALNAGDLTILDGLQELSIHAVVKLEDVTQRHHVLGKGGSSDFVRFFFEPSGTNGKLRIPKMFVGIGGTTVRAEGGADDDFPAGEIVRFGGAWRVNNSDGVQAWINGVMKGTGSSTAHGSGVSLANTSESLYVGKRTSSPSETWDGLVGEIAIWRKWLDSEMWEALGSGLSALEVLQEELIFWSGMRADGSTEWYWLPQSDTLADFTHENTPVAVVDDYDLVRPWQEEEGEDLVSSSSPTYSPFAKIATLTKPPGGSVPVSYVDSPVANGLAYKYEVRGVDETGNPGTFSSEITVTPAAGSSGALPPGDPTARLRAAALAKARANRARGFRG